MSKLALRYIGHRCTSDGAIKPWNFTGTLAIVPGECFHIPANGILVLGRGRNADIRVLSNGVAKAHATVKFAQESQALLVTDLESSNGTLINGKQLQSSGLAHVGDRISLADRFDFELIDLETY